MYGHETKIKVVYWKTERNMRHARRFAADCSLIARYAAQVAVDFTSVRGLVGKQNADDWNERGYKVKIDRGLLVLSRGMRELRFFVLQLFALIFKQDSISEFVNL